MNKKLFCGLLAASICLCTGCSANKSLSNKDLPKDKSSEAGNTVSTGETKPPAAVPPQDNLNTTAPTSNQTNTSTNTQATASKGTEVTLTSELKTQLNSFFTVIVKTRVPAFEKDKLNNDDLILFGVRYNFINNSQALEKYEKEKNMAKLPEKYVDSAVEKYFGLKLKTHDIFTEEIYYADGYYYLPYNLKIANTFAQVEKLVDEGNGIYSADVTTYSATPGSSVDPNASKKEWKQAGQMPKVFMNMRARIKKVNIGYILVEYLRV